MGTEDLLVERHGACAVLTITRPGAANALDEATLTALAASVAAVGRDPSTRVLVVTGAGEESFIGGLVPDELLQWSPEHARRMAAAGQAVGEALDALPVPSIAAVNGWAIGGGFETALACDLAIASENALFMFIEPAAGLFPGFSGSWRLPRRVGAMRAAEIIYTARPVAAAEALGLGIVLDVTPPGELLARCLELAERIAANSADGVRLAKRALHSAAELPLGVHNAWEREAFGSLFGTDDMRQRMGALAGGAALDGLRAGA